MSDLVERLRHYYARRELPTWGEIHESADRIEALEAALREIKDQYLTPDQSSAIARAALVPPGMHKFTDANGPDE